MSVERINIALQFLNEGKWFKVDNLRLAMTGLNNLEIRGWSQTGSLKSITHLSAMEELNNVKSEFNDMLTVSDQLKDFVKAKTLAFILAFDDYGKVSIDIVEERDDIIYWKIGSLK
jgi:hypothetical protein